MAKQKTKRSAWLGVPGACPWLLWISWIVAGKRPPMVGIERQRTPTNTTKTRGARGRVRNERVSLAPQTKAEKQVATSDQNRAFGRAGPFPDLLPDHVKTHDLPPSLISGAGSPAHGCHTGAVRKVSGVRSQ